MTAVLPFGKLLFQEDTTPYRRSRVDEGWLEQYDSVSYRKSIHSGNDSCTNQALAMWMVRVLLDPFRRRPAMCSRCIGLVNPN